MANIMSMTKLRNKVSRNGFDLSRKNLFTAKVGEALPVACIECIPGDSIDIDMAWFTRTQPVNTAAYTRLREYYDWYFVPTNLLWNKFNTFVTQMSDNNQKATGINGNVKLTNDHPYFTTAQVVNYLRSMYWAGSSVQKTNFFGYRRADLTVKLLDYLGYGDFSSVGLQQSNSDYGIQNAKLNPFPLLAYQKIYQDFIRDSQWEKAYAPSSNIDYISGADGTLNLPISEIDTNSENMFDLRYYNWNKDYFMGLQPNSQYGAASIVSSELQADGNPLWLQIPNTQSFSFYPVSVTGVGSGGDGSPIVGDGIQYRGYDQFYNIGSNVAADNAMSFKIRDSEVLNLRVSLGLDKSYVSSEDAARQLQSKFTILALRQAEAKQKWQEITQSQQQDYKAQINAHFGVDVSEAYSDRCKYLGGVSGNIDIDPVTNQNLTGDNDANIAGRGQGGSRGTIKYDAKVHGYIMCIYHAVPLLDYAVSGVHRQNLKTNVFDYAIPEFDATGMVSVPAIELLNNKFVGDGAGQVDLTNVLLGYAPRYIDYKISYDAVHGGFVHGGLNSWVAPVANNYIYEYLENLGASLITGALNYHFFKIPPSVLNPIFGVDADSTTSTDQLLVNAGFDIKAVRNLDRNGLPF